jgi:hypothetical protein
MLKCLVNLNKSDVLTELFIHACAIGSSDLTLFRNSVHFMCFWFGPEILRLVLNIVPHLRVEKISTK